MATHAEVQNALYEKIKNKLDGSALTSVEILKLAEAFAWATAQSQPHGGSASAPKG